MKGFMPVGSGRSNSSSTLEKKVIANSKTLSIGHAVLMSVSDEAVEAVGAGVPVYGIIVGFEQKNGSTPPRDNGAGGNFYTTYTTAADNETVLQMCALIVTDKQAKFSADVDAALGTTGNSLIAGNKFDVLAASDELDESTVLSASGQFLSHGVDPENSARLIVSINESQVYG